MVLVSCNIILPEDTWTVTVFIPSAAKVVEMLPSKVTIGYNEQNKLLNIYIYVYTICIYHIYIYIW